MKMVGKEVVVIVAVVVVVVVVELQLIRHIC